MDTPRIALRFRDSTPDVDTISEHRRILSSQGSVWWGWWKKESEDDGHLILTNAGLPPGLALLMDRSTRNCFVATYSKIIVKGMDFPDEAKIPPYYRSIANDIAAWFLLTSIKTATYDETIGARFGESTLLEINSSPTPQPAARPNSTVISSRDRRCILHLTDLHFGADYAFRAPNSAKTIVDQKSSLTEALIADLRRQGKADAIGAILITGDFTTRGDWNDDTRSRIIHELHALASELKLSKSAIVAAPGNHDIVRYPDGGHIDFTKVAVDRQKDSKHEREFRTFNEDLTGRHWKEPLDTVVECQLQDANVHICVLNSCKILACKWTEYGYVGVSGLDALTKLANLSVSKPTYRIMALHHHLVPVARVDVPTVDGVSLTLDAVELLDAAEANDVHIAIHGHQHLPRLAHYRNILRVNQGDAKGVVIFGGGSAGVSSTRRPGDERNSYSVFEFNALKASVSARELRHDSQAGAVIFDTPLPISPSIP